MNITARITRPSHIVATPFEVTRTSASTPPSRPPNTRGTGEPAHAQRTATTAVIEASATSGPVSIAPERAEVGSTTPAATPTTATTARVTATAADRRCNRTVNRATTSR